ncbi:cytosine/adenosine deaminase [Syntrophotalea carbinolica DSM 2380]|uniref:Cytosine/adenosine deaminase n=1 Tax=Syntrophotalea carbinolica (strain DSM 2380 / NBRC 103641 / GraBd1) TaxID=338963 RepID=Q3A6T8_SYNC1|nr:nucleoside deaminase [Syntrophotalea carbinolica]ABA87919.1 cytosine/adenosine deaminase [Syntrophotalea carbinolica DSM 2380]
MSDPAIHLPMPAWLSEVLPPPEQLFETPESRMRLAIELAEHNIRHGSGGPFGAAVFDLDSGRLIAPGVNLVTSTCCSVAHAELVALMLAQKYVGSFSLADAGRNAELTSSTEPCAMCLGALPWAGLKQLACGARETDARAVGFDEGDKPPQWPGLLEKRGIRVLRDICRPQAVAVLQQYRRMGGEIYNGRAHK